MDVAAYQSATTVQPNQHAGGNVAVNGADNVTEGEPMAAVHGAPSTWQGGHYGHPVPYPYGSSYYGAGYAGGDAAAAYHWHQAQYYHRYNQMMYHHQMYSSAMTMPMTAHHHHYQLPHHSQQQVEVQKRHSNSNEYAPNPSHMYDFNDIYRAMNPALYTSQQSAPGQTVATIPTSLSTKFNIREFSIRNVVCNFSLPMHIDLHKFATSVWNCVFYPNTTVLTKAMRKPRSHVRVYSSGKVYIVGCKSETESRVASRKIGRQIQKAMGYRNEQIFMQNHRISNILATCKLPFGIMIQEMARRYPKECEYEPELTVGAVWRSQEPRAVMRIHTTGTISVTGATSEAGVIAAIEKIYPIVAEFRCDPNVEQMAKIVSKDSRKRAYRSQSVKDVEIDPVFFVKRKRGRNACAVQLKEDEYNELVECPEFFDVEGDFEI
uniref:TATA box-binding protein-like 1 n=1 Tax=Panagrellus redivivus TaxID=6233 RepID=A0A7E4V0Q3_PANRE